MPKPRMVASDSYKERPIVLRYWCFKSQLQLLWPKDLINDEYCLIFQMKMPKSWSKKKKILMNGEPHRVRPDIDNCLKTILDCLHQEDSQVWNISMQKRWAYDGAILIKDT